MTDAIKEVEQETRKQISALNLVQEYNLSEKRVKHIINEVVRNEKIRKTLAIFTEIIHSGYNDTVTSEAIRMTKLFYISCLDKYIYQESLKKTSKPLF